MQEESIYMLNALWFKKDGGSELYQQYIEAVGPIMSTLGARLVDSYIPEVTLVGEWDPDLFFVVEWPGVSAFEAFLENDDYRKIMHLREEAIEKSLLIRCAKSPM